jgi:hypothetical protein
LRNEVDRGLVLGRELKGLESGGVKWAGLE